MVVKILTKKCVSQNVLKQIINDTDDGITFLDLRTCLLNEGITGNVVSLDCVELRSVRKPVIIQMKLNAALHYVVVARSIRGKFEILDPLLGRYWMDEKKLSNEWNGYALLVENEVQKERIKTSFIKEDYRKLIGEIFKRAKGKIICFWLLSGVVYFLSIYLAGYYSAIFDFIIPAGSIEIIMPVCIIYLLIALLHAVLCIVNVAISAGVNEGIDGILSKESIGAIVRGGRDNNEKFRENDLLRMVADTKKIRNMLAYLILTFPISIATVIITEIIIAKHGRVLAVIALMPIIVHSIFVLLIDNSLETATYKSIITELDYQSRVKEVIEDAEEIVNIGAEDFYLDDCMMRLKKVATCNRRVAITTQLCTSVQNAVLTLYTISILGVGALMIIRGVMNEGLILVLNSFSMMLFEPFHATSNVLTLMKEGKFSAERYLEVTTKKNNIQSRNAGNLIIDEIEFRNVEFGFKPGEKILSEISFKVSSGMNIGIIGENGSGKTTLLKLIANYYKCGGKRFLNGKEYDGILDNQVTNNVIIIQRGKILTGTVYENMVMGRDFSMVEVRSTAKKLGIDQTFINFKDGYETMIGEGIRSLSKGQEQMIYIMRGAMSVKPVNLLDEATNYLDRDIKEQVMKYYCENGKINFYVSHDEEVIQKMDVVYMIEEGKIRTVRTVSKGI